MTDLRTVPGHSWWALRIAPRGMMPKLAQAEHLVPEFPAVLSLRRHGFDVWVPTEQWSRRRNRYTHERVVTRRPLIPGLALVSIPDGGEPNFEVLRRCPYFLGWYGILRRVEAPDADRIGRMEDIAGAQPSDPYALRPGMRAQMIRGPMIEAQLELAAIDIPQGVARGLMEIFGAKVEIVVPLSDLKAAE